MAEVLDSYARLKEQAENALRQRAQSDKIRVQVGSATCENAAGAERVFEEFQKHLATSGRQDIALRRVGCTGRCSREPIVSVILPGQAPVKYGPVDVDLVHRIFTQHVLGGQAIAPKALGADEPRAQYELFMCAGELCGSAVEHGLQQVFAYKLGAAALPKDRAQIVSASCLGLCPRGKEGAYMHVLVRPGKVIYRVSAPGDIDRIIDEHLRQGRVVEDLRVHDAPVGQRFFEMYGDSVFFQRQTRLALRNSGIVDPEHIDEYIHYNGFEALARVLDRGDPEWVISEVKTSKLRGRGGAGYPTGLKWAQGRATPSDIRYVICNADEGDPGAFMDRSMLEGDPFSVLEGMCIGAFAVGASRGFLYIRAEYPMAIQRVQTAIERMRERGLLGKNILGSKFDFDLEIRLGAGAFVCGEETSLIHSIEGLRGQPSIRPPYPTTSGLWDKPTVINNVETWANVPVVILYGATWFANVGTASSGGTKVFALAGQVRHTGLVEVPMGSTLRDIVFDIGGGVRDGKQLKAIQTGGPAGGCIPAKWLDTPVDFDTLVKAGSMMGSGGMIVMDSDDCMVDIAKFYLTFSQDESCGKCTPCREGTTRMLEILDRITAGQGAMEDLDKLERLGKLLRKASLCGLGRAAPNPVLSTLTHFKDEYLAHVVDKRCPANRCKALSGGRKPSPGEPQPVQADGDVRMPDNFPRTA
jgi:NADH:ubiquinone oxidoreductase subunit F (NADH-binding)/(2Fe-2S) ferredoxin